MKSYLLKVYHNYNKGKASVAQFLHDISKTMEDQKMIIWLNYSKGEYYYSLDTADASYPSFESQFYTTFDNFQIVTDTKGVWDYDMSKTVIDELKLENSWFFPFKMDNDDDTDFIFNILRSFENLDLTQDKFGFFIMMEATSTNSFSHYFRSWWSFLWFKVKLNLQFYKYMFSIKTKKWWKDEWYKYYNKKIQGQLFRTRIFMVCQAHTKSSAKAKLAAIENNFQAFEEYPLNQFELNIDSGIKTIAELKNQSISNWYLMTPQELSQFFQFPKNPKNETSLLKVTSKKLSLPIGIPTFEYEKLKNGEIMAKESPREINILGTSDYRSTTVPVGMYDEDRLRHMYIIGKTGTGKSKFMLSLMVDDILKGKGMAIIDPHGDAIEELLQFVPESRKQDVIIFDPMDEKFPFCLNPLDVSETDSKQVLAKWFIDIFKKFFGANWNSMLEHVLRMIFLALLDKPGSTMFDIIRALTDKDFRYTMIESINDDVVRNFWTNEFAWWSQQFNTQAIMPILNKVWQLLSIDALKNIFASKENKLDFREAMDSSKIVFIKLSKGKLQEEIMWFLGAMFVTKIYQTAMGRQWLEKEQRIPFFLYVDEFQNFATETFNEILSEARKYWLGMMVAHQYINQIPGEISKALFGNVWSLFSFRISSDDAKFMANHFDPFLDAYDLANLNMRECYAKIQVKWQVKDPFSMKTRYTPDTKVSRQYIEELYTISRARYSRSLEEAKKIIEVEQADVVHAIDEGFGEPLI